ncbi:IS110 family transposase [Xanthomonas cannabis]|uniref:IS110 family transposase n=1 Tax=Xanthomonas cannabis TaxID=1885674 RepID=UPI0033AA0C9B
MSGIGIDVCKKSLDAAVFQGEARQFSNTASGHCKLVHWLRTLPVRQVVLEATGGYELAALDALHQAGVPVARANASRARHLANGLGLAKTDRLDAGMLACMAEKMELHPYVPLLPWQRHLGEHVRARRQLIDLLKTAKQQLLQVADKPLRKLLQANVNQLVRSVARLDELIAGQLKTLLIEQPHLAALKTLKGVGPVLLAVLACRLPELGTLNGKQISRLVGVAPLSRDSGKMRGKRGIGGGRADIRQALYMAAMSSARHEPRLRDFYRALRTRGKEGKVAIVAVMRKMLVILNARVRDERAATQPA